MTDEEFLAYCYSHAESERCGFTPRQLERLMILAGNPDRGALFRKMEPCVINCNEMTIKELVKTAESFRKPGVREKDALRRIALMTEPFKNQPSSIAAKIHSLATSAMTPIDTSHFDEETAQ